MTPNPLPLTPNLLTLTPDPSPRIPEQGKTGLALLAANAWDAAKGVKPYSIKHVYFSFITLEPIVE